ncbi:MAG TPA: extracellular solute-binding protein [Actinopolymorphaceae bacterium]
MGSSKHGHTVTFGRRSLLLGSAALAAGAAGLTGCGGDGNGPRSKGAASGGKLTPPTYVPFPGVEPDIPPNDQGVPAAFFDFPNPPLERDGFPLRTSKPITMLLQGSALDVPPAQNTHFKLLEKAIGAKINMIFGGFVEYKDKFQVTMASGDLPDIVMMITVPGLPQLLASKFTDLTGYLSGAKVEEYPGLASIPSDGWKVPELEGRLWGIPQARPSVGRILSTRGDLLEKKGIERSPKLDSGQDFLALLEELTDAKNNVFAMGADPQAWLLEAILEMMEAPNGWREEGGKFVSVLESEEMKAALEKSAKIWKAGYLHPNSFSDAGSNFEWLRAGTTSLYLQAFSGWGQYAQDYPDWQMGVIALPKWEGGGPARKHLDPAGYGAYAAIRQQESEDRLREILRVLDYIASPFGTKQYLEVNYGVEGQHYTMTDGNPVPTKRAAGERVRPIQYCGSQLNSLLYIAGQAEVVKEQHAFLTRVMPGGEQDASYGLYSETAVTKGATAALEVTDAQKEMIQGRRPLSEWDAVVKEWRQAAGDRIRGEYEEAAAKAR